MPEIIYILGKERSITCLEDAMSEDSGSGPVPDLLEEVVSHVLGH